MQARNLLGEHDAEKSSVTNMNPGDKQARNIVLLGEDGVGKSSIVNMIAGHNVTAISDQLGSGTLESTVHPIKINQSIYCVYDTPAIDSATLGNDAVTKLILGLEEGVSLLVFCMRGRITHDTIRIYEHFFKSLCQEKVPAVIVITGLENEDPMESWWERNQRRFEESGMHFAGHACVTATRGKRLPGIDQYSFDKEYRISREAVKRTIEACCSQNSWKVLQSQSVKLQSPMLKSDSNPSSDIQKRRKRFRLIIVTVIVIVVVVVIVLVVTI